MPLPRFLVLAATLLAGLLFAAAPASARDRNHDRLPDKWEKHHHLSLKVKQARRDQDHDGLRNLGEFRAGTNPRRADSDRDGVKDGDENAGTIASFENGVLTIALAGGGELSGKVTDATKIECPAAAPTARASGHGDDDGDDDSDSGDDDHSGPGHGGDDADDDHGDNEGDDDHGDDEGDDDHGDDQGDDDHGDDDHGDDDEAGCGTAALVAGTQVREAELKVSSAGRVFKEIELGRPAA